MEELKKALREAILERRRVLIKDPETNKIEWTKRVQAWAKLCDLDLSLYDASNLDFR